jgi:hypothetical protein
LVENKKKSQQDGIVIFLDALNECDAAGEVLKCSMERNKDMAKDLIRAVQDNGAIVRKFA